MTSREAKSAVVADSIWKPLSSKPSVPAKGSPAKGLPLPFPLTWPSYGVVFIPCAVSDSHGLFGRHRDRPRLTLGGSRSSGPKNVALLP